MKQYFQPYFPGSAANFRIEDEEMEKYADILEFSSLGSIFEISTKTAAWKRRKMQFWNEKPLAMENFPRQRGKTSAGQVFL